MQARGFKAFCMLHSIIDISAIACEDSRAMLELSKREIKMNIVYNDTDGMPDSRGDETCLNCCKRWSAHKGWLCNYLHYPHVSSLRSKLASDKRYKTKDMIE